MLYYMSALRWRIRLVWGRTAVYPCAFLLVMVSICANLKKGDRKQQRRQAAELLRTVTDFEKRSQKAIDEKEILVYYCIIGLIQLLFIFTTRNICQRKYITKLLPCSGFKTASRIFAFGGEADSGGLEYIVRFRKEECYGKIGRAHV